MSWGSYWISPWVFFGPIVTLLLMMVCMAGMFFMTRVGTIHHSSAEIGPIGPSFGAARNSGDSPLPSKNIAIQRWRVSISSRGKFTAKQSLTG